MSSVHSSSSNTGNEYYEFGERFPILHCRCGHQLKIRTSWTNENPGRRFWQCSGGGSHRQVGCGFVDWYDPPMCYRSKRIILGLLKRINKLEEDIRTLHMKKIEGDKKEAGNVLKKIVGIMLLIFVGYIGSQYCGSDL
ncbi:PREDICTED: uncharacterized protein LOC109191957 [Ipomoea nil]|uniref:uncharacterized protein LOC109191957 n=1 Tax=Ipomoea nil TaxID=35883 RepID=UPI000901D694|nr:PREDICTED: uncharacterized protein LOC109191957 [Ipomoea nil]